VKARPPGPGARWGAIGAAVVGYELWTIYNEPDGDTLSEVLREVFHVNSPAGKAGWWLFWGGVSVWVGLHIADEDSVPCLDKRR
jgi:hypothetical protein